MKFVVPALLLCFIAACSSPQKLLQQEWKIDDVQFIDSLNTYTAEQKGNISQSLKTSFGIRFKPDSVYVATHLNKTITGKWWFSKNGKTLYTNNILDGTIVSKIHELSKDRLEFETTNSEKQTYIYTCSPKK